MCNYWDKSELNINTAFAVTVLMLCVIPHIHKYASDNSYIDHRKKFSNVIKTLFHGLSEVELHFTQDIF